MLLQSARGCHANAPADASATFRKHGQASGSAGPVPPLGWLRAAGRAVRQVRGSGGRCFLWEAGAGGTAQAFLSLTAGPGSGGGVLFIWYLPYGFCVALRLGNELCRARVFGEYRVTVAHPCAAYFCRGVAADRVHWFPSSGFSW